MSFLKTAEEKAKEAKERAELQLKAEESSKQRKSGLAKFFADLEEDTVVKKLQLTSKQRKSELEKLIANCKKDIVVKYALRIFNEREANQDNNVESKTQAEEIYRNKANKIAEYIGRKESSSLEISRKLSETASTIERLAGALDMKIDAFPEENEPPEYENIRKGVLPVLFPTLSVTTGKVPQYPESDRLRKLSKQILMSSNGYYNHHLIEENRAFTSDDDPKATPFNFFKMKRIIEFARTLPNDQMKHRYLQQMNNAYIDKDGRGHIYNADGKKVFGATDLFLKQMRKEISLYNQTPQKDSQQTAPSNKPTIVVEDDDQPDTPLRPANKHNRQGSQKQIFLALQIIIRHLGGVGDNSDNARFMSFLSGFSSESMRQNFSKSEPQKNGELTDEWKNKKAELEKVRQIFIDCKLPKMAKLADDQIKKMDS